MAKSKINSSLKQLLDRRMCFYPGARQKAIITALCFDEERKKAELLREIVNEFLKKIPEHRQNQLLSLHKEMTPEQRSYPHKMAKERY